MYNLAALNLRDTNKINKTVQLGECLTIFSWRMPYNGIKLGNMYNLAALCMITPSVGKPDLDKQAKIGMRE